ncbi:uncharacterized protein LOC128254809 [Drosophila gunungcola]|uniref:Uncharacterized protein n=1 Tax=Drosophila gunungcola TaxID=103775 RepID=A0A9P9YL08_9MUSC|nr:uncharacterized protein LOC128254809 [Drosophila gunungcola]KAI8038806.1 hypothetical protein M5D96_008714 [Drosophila gunungcola]
MDSPTILRQKPQKLPKMVEDLPKLAETEKVIINEMDDQAIVYDYMKYPSKKAKGKLFKKPRKTVSFKTMVELVTYTDNWKMRMSESKLRTEEEQLKYNLKRRNS